MPQDDDTKTLAQWRVERLIDEKVKIAIDDYRKTAREDLVTAFKLELSKYETAYAVGKWLAGVLVVMAIGTAYQLFVNLAVPGAG